MTYEAIPIWEGFPDEYQPKHGVPILNAYRIDAKESRPAVLILPGSAYVQCCDDEAEPIALKFTAEGYNAFVLYYSVRPNTYPQPFYDGFRALLMLRENAEAWGIDPNKIAVVGFSAGGHLAAGLGVLSGDEAFFGDIPLLRRESCKPNAVVLGYSLINGFGAPDCFENLLGETQTTFAEKVSFDKNIPTESPPVFIWHPHGDTRVPIENSLSFAYALREAGVLFEFHIYSGGFHGMAACDNPEYTDREKRIGNWLKMALEWLPMAFENPKFK